MNTQYLFNLVVDMSELTEERLISVERVDVKGNKCRVIELSLPQEKMIDTGHQKLEVNEHHITFYQCPIESGKFQNHYHYTMSATDIKDGKNYKARVYFQANDLVNTEPVFVPVERNVTFIELGEFYEKFMDLSKQYTAPILGKLRSHQKATIKTIEQECAKSEGETFELHTMMKQPTQEVIEKYKREIDYQIALLEKKSRYSPKFNPSLRVQSLQALKAQILSPSLSSVTSPSLERTSDSSSKQHGRESTEQESLAVNPIAQKHDVASPALPSATQMRKAAKRISTFVTSLTSLTKRLDEIHSSSDPEHRFMALQQIWKDLCDIKIPEGADYEEQQNTLKNKSLLQMIELLRDRVLVIKNISWLLDNREVLSSIGLPDEIYVCAIQGQKHDLLSRLIAYEEIPAEQKIIYSGAEYNIMELCIVLRSVDCFKTLLKLGYSPYSFGDLKSPLLLLLSEEGLPFELAIMESCDMRTQASLTNRMISSVRNVISWTPETPENAELLGRVKLQLNILQARYEQTLALSAKFRGGGRNESFFISNTIRRMNEVAGRILSKEQKITLANNIEYSKALIDSINSTTTLISSKNVNPDSVLPLLSHNGGITPQQQFTMSSVFFNRLDHIGYLLPFLINQQKGLTLINYEILRLFDEGKVTEYTKDGQLIFKNQGTKETKKAMSQYTLNMQVYQNYADSEMKKALPKRVVDILINDRAERPKDEEQRLLDQLKRRMSAEKEQAEAKLKADEAMRNKAEAERKMAEAVRNNAEAERNTAEAERKKAKREHLEVTVLILKNQVTVEMEKANPPNDVELKKMMDAIKRLEDEATSLKPEEKRLEDEAKRCADEAMRLAHEVMPLADEANRLANEGTRRTDEAKRLADEVKRLANEAKPLEDEAKPLADEVKPLADEVKPLADEVKPLADSSGDQEYQAVLSRRFGLSGKKQSKDPEPKQARLKPRPR